MCSRILTGAALIAALLVSCRGNAAAAAKNEKTEADGNTVEAVHDTVAVHGKPELAYDSRYYTTDMVWEPNCVYFKNLHIMDRSGSSGARAMPVVDTRLWSSAQVAAGIYFMESIPGIGLNMIKCQDPAGFVKGDDTVSCEWKDAYGYRNFRLKMDENTITVEGFDPKSGEPVDNWFLSLIVAREKSYDLPFSVIVPDRVSAMQGNTEYHLDIDHGTVALNSEDTPPVFIVYPKDGTITLGFGEGN